MFKFVTVSHPDQMKERKKQAGIRQHAIRNGIKRSRADRAKRRDIFVPFDVEEKREKKASNAMMKTPSIGLMDPFDTLCGCPEMLRTLLRHPSARQAGEPVFCVEDSGKVFFQGMDTILKGALTDPAPFHALSLVLTFGVNRNIPNVDILVYRGELLKGLQDAMLEPGWKPKVSTISALLMLIGYEYRIEGGDCASIAAHIKGVQTMMAMFQAVNVAVVEQLQRTLFWQDLLSCFILGTSRLLSHENYLNFQHAGTRDHAEVCETTSGFSPLINTWPPAFTVVLKDLDRLCATVDRCNPSKPLLENFPIDNSQANIESRLVDLLSASRRADTFADPIYEACIFAAYLCTYKLSISIWNGCFVPEICVDQILLRLMNALSDSRWAFSSQALLWLLFVAGGLTERRSMRERIKTLIGSAFVTYLEGLHEDWEAAKEMLKAFIWSDFAMEEKVYRFWEGLHPQEGPMLQWEQHVDPRHCEL